MAELSFTNLANLLLGNYGATIAENVVTYGPGNWLVPAQSMIGRLQARGRVVIGGGDGNNVKAREWAVHYAGATAASYGVADVYPAATQESYMPAYLEFKRVGVSISYDDMVRASSGAAYRGGINVVQNDFEKKVKELISRVEQHLWTDGTGNGSKDVTGFLAFLATNLVYGTIDQATYAWWRSILTNAAAASLAKSHLRSTVRSLYSHNGIGPSTEMWMSLTQWHKYLELYEDNIRYAPGGEASDRLVPMYSDGAISIPIYLINGVPTSEIWILNLDELELRFKDQAPADELPSADGTVTQEGIPIGIKPVYENRDVSSYFLRTWPQLVCENPYHTARIYGLATS